MTVSVVVITATVSVWALLDTDGSPQLVRDHQLFWSGQWWRVVSPILVQPDGWGQFGFNLAGIAVVGAALERAVRQLRHRVWTWGCSYLLAGVGSNLVLATLVLSDHDGGSSACVAGLIGALAVVDTRGPRRATGPLAVLAGVYSVFFCVYLFGLDLAGGWAAAAAGDVFVSAYAVGRRIAGVVSANIGKLALVIVSAVVMSLRLDDHGFGLLVGAVVMTVSEFLGSLGPNNLE